MEAIQNTWALSEVEWASDKPLRYCGFEISMGAAGDGFYVSQGMYEQELMTRWDIKESLQYPAFKVTEDDEQFVGEIDPNDVRTAQMMTGALLWLSTRTRPDLVFGVSAMSRLTTKNPKKAVEIGYVLLKYLYGNPGGMHYPQTIPGGDWGRRDQLKAKRHQKMLEVFSDISYAAGTDHKSIQGLVVYYAGVPIAWQCGVQTFVAHSTAEAELIAYCESLVVGRATEALLASIWQQWDFEVIYGDNAAAINLAHGVTTASWRTRHLRIRASVLKEALDESKGRIGGGWKLLHLKGTELVADGCTKPLHGQAFTQFVDDLGLRRTRRVQQPVREDRPAVGGEHHGAAMRAMMVGGVLLSTAEAHGEENEEVFDRVWTAGILLVALGVIYSGQLLFQASRCCLRRMRQCSTRKEDQKRGEAEPEDVDERPSTRLRSTSRSGSSSDGGVSARQCMTSQSGSMSIGRSGSPRLNLTSRSGSACDDGALRLNLPSRSGSACSDEASMSLCLTSRSGFACGDGGSARLKSSSHSGPMTCTEAPTSRSLSSQSGSATKAGASSRRTSANLDVNSEKFGKGAGASVTSTKSLASAGSTMSTNLTRSSGSESAGEGSTSLKRRTRSGLELEASAGNPADVADFVAASEIRGDLVGSSVGEISGSSEGHEIQNPWNKFQHKYKGLGMTSTALAKLYKGRMSKDSP